MSYDDRNLDALDQLEDLLEAYAEGRLAPTGPVLARIRLNVVAQAASAEAARRPVEAAAAGSPRRRFALPGVHVPTRAFAFGMAAALTAGTVAAVAAAPPGNLLYDARVALENISLLGSADDQLAAHVRHLDARLAEAEAAAARGDAGALAGALAAYRSEIDGAIGAVGDDPVRLASLQATLSSQVDLLEALAVQAPADTAVGQAINAGQQAVRHLKDAKDAQDHPNHRPSVPPGQESSPPNRP